MGQAAPLTKRLFVVEDLPLRYLVIPKCGCTYVKNVLWHLRTGQPHPNPLRVHDDDAAFPRAFDLGLTAAEIAAEEFAFTVIRHPLDRFLSLYFDKIIGEGRAKFVPLARTLVDRYGLDPDPAGPEDHRVNLLITINWLRTNLNAGNDLPTDPHWSPQVYRRNILKQCNLKLLQVAQLTEQMRYLLGAEIPRIEAVLHQAEQNRSHRSLPKSTVLDDEIRAAVNEVYAADKTLYQKTGKAWAGLDMANPDPARVPRYRDLYP